MDYVRGFEKRQIDMLFKASSRAPHYDHDYETYINQTINPDFDKWLGLKNLYFENWTI